MHRFTIVALAAALGAVGCDKGGESGGESKPSEAKAPEPEPFEPGVMVEKKLSAVGATIQVPDNLEMKAEGDTVTFTAEGFPTVTVTREERTDGNFGSSSMRGTSSVSRTLGTPTRVWKCSAKKPGEFGEALKTICDSLAPDADPKLTAPKCEVEGLDKAQVEAAVKAQEEAIKKCFSAQVETEPTYTGGRWHLNLTKKGNSTSFSHTVGNQAVMKCLGELTGTIRDAEALKAEGDASASCEVTFTAY